MSNIWNEVDERWYEMVLTDRVVKRKKIIPLDLKLTPLTLCVWHMDDGSANSKDANIELNTQGFTLDEIEFLICKLDKDLGIKSHKKTGGKKNGQFKIYVGRKSYFDFIEMIKPHVEWDCFQYKIDTSKYNKKAQIGEDHFGSILTEEKVKKIFKMFDAGVSQKEIATKIGISKASVSLITSGERWQHLGISRSKTNKPRLTHEKKKEIVILNNEGLLQKEIAERLNINQSSVSRVLKESECHALN